MKYFTLASSALEVTIWKSANYAFHSHILTSQGIPSTYLSFQDQLYQLSNQTGLPVLLPLAFKENVIMKLDIQKGY